MTRDEAITALSQGGRSLRVHLIGVAGSGMSGLAALLIGLGHRVSGSDRVSTSETERLQGAGLDFSSPHTAAAGEDAEVVVYSSAVRCGNLAYDAAVGRGLPMLRRAEALAAVMANRDGIVVAGTHGKTTTSAMTAHVLRAAGMRPSHYVGAEIPVLGTNARLGEGRWFVAEGDESDGTLVAFHPEHAVILNVEAEHLDHYGEGAAGLAAIMAVFHQLVANTRGTVFFCGDDPGASAVCADRSASVSYGFGEGCRVRAVDLATLGQSSEFLATADGEPLGRVILNLPGRHNVLNALAVIAVTREVGCPFGVVRDALATFRGARRRFEVRFASKRFRVVDDYGHHPTEIAATLEAARGLDPHRVICLFQPHRFTRTRLLAREFGSAFDAADLVMVTDVYPASEPPIEGVSGRTVVDSIRERGHTEAISTPTFPEAAIAAGNALRPGDLVLTLGAGDIHKVAGILARDLGILERLREALGDEPAEMRLYEPMSRHTTLRVGGPAQFWIEVRTVEGLARAVRFLRTEAVPIRVIGRGSNLLIRDGGLRGAVIHPSRGEFDRIEVRGDLLEAGAGARFKAVASAARAAGLGGFEWMEGIPGSVGGGLRMNAGAMGTETFDQVVRVRLLTTTGEVVEKERDAIEARYRQVPELNENFAVSAVFRGVPDEVAAIDARLAASKAKRKRSQPVAASAGCIFKNPDSIPAGRLVDELGLKGTGIGGAAVSDVHGNFIVNQDGATATDVLELIESIRAAAREQRGIELETEVQILGQESSIV